MDRTLHEKLPCQSEPIWTVCATMGTMVAPTRTPPESDLRFIGMIVLLVVALMAAGAVSLVI